MSKKQKTSSTSEPYSAEYKPYVYDAQKKIWSDVNTPATPYTGQLSTGITGTQQSAINNISNATDNQKLTDISQGKYLDYTENPTFMKAFGIGSEKLQKQFGDNYDQINTSFTNGIFNSNARRNALNDSAERANDDMSTFATNLISNYENQANNNMSNAINSVNQLNNSQLNAGNTEQSTLQSGLDKQYADSQYTTSLDQQSLQNMLAWLQLVKSPQEQSTSSDGGAAAANALGTIFGATMGAKTK